MGTVILIVWAIFMLWSALQGVKIMYSKSEKQRAEDWKNLIAKYKDDKTVDEEVKKYLIPISLFIGYGSYALFWLFVATIFVNPIAVSYCCIIVAITIYNYFRTLKMFESKEVKLTAFDKIGYITSPLNVVTIASFIVVLIL